MIKEFKTYVITCNGCDAELPPMDDLYNTEKLADVEGWHRRMVEVWNRKIPEHYCPKCIMYEEDILYVRTKK